MAMHLAGVRNPLFPTWAAPYEAYSYYCDSLSGDDANAGTFLRPWRTTAPWNALTHTPGMSLGLKRGGIYRPAVGANETILFTGSGSVNGSVLVGAYGYGPAPVVMGSQPIRAVTSGWTAVAGTEYKIATTLTYAATYGGMYYTTPGSAPVYLTQGTAGSLAVGQFRVTAGTWLNVNIGRAPTSQDTFEVPQSELVQADGRSYCEVRDLCFRFSGHYGIQLANTTTLSNFTVRRCDFGYGTGDHLNAYTYATNCLIEDSWFHDNPSNLGDGISFHGVASNGRPSATIRRCLFQRLGKNGVGNSSLGTFVTEDCGFDAANLTTYSDGTDGGSHTVRRCWFNNDIPNSSGGVYHMVLGGAANHYIYNISMNKGYSDNATFRAVVMTDSAIVTMRNVNIQGTYQLGLYATAAGALDINYVNIFGATTARSGVSVGANDIASSAAYVAPTVNGLALGAASASRGAGVLVAGVNDGAVAYDIGHVVRR